MKKHILIAFVCAGLMLVTPLTGIAQENKVSNNLTDEPDVEGLVAQLRVVIDEILENYGHIPIVRGLCNVILKLNWFPGKVICNFIELLIIVILYTMGFCIVYDLPIYFILILAIFGDAFGMISIRLQCPPIFPVYDYPLPFKSLYTLSETNDITNLVNDCHCLQE